MSRKKDFNEGMGQGIKLAEKVIHKEAETMDYLKMTIDNISETQNGVREAVENILEYQNDMAVEKYYGICNSISPQNLPDEEKKVLLNVLSTLAMKSNQYNENQKMYVANLKHYVNLADYRQNSEYSFELLENIRNLDYQEIICRCMLEFLFLQENDFSFMGDYEEMFDFFSIKNKTFKLMMDMINITYYLFGENGIVEIYGDYGFDEEPRNMRFYNVERKSNSDISLECAQICFSEEVLTEQNRLYIESADYIIVGKGKNLYSIEKRTGKKTLILENIENVEEYIKKKKLCTYSNMAYYVIDNDLFFYDLVTNECGFIEHISEEENDKGEKYEVENLYVINSKKLFYQNGSTYIANLDDIQGTCKKKSFGFTESEYYVCDNYIYCLVSDMDDNAKEKDDQYYILRKYNTESDSITDVSVPFGRHPSNFEGIKGLYSLYFDGIYGNYYFAVFEYSSFESVDRLGFDCFYIRIDNNQTIASAHVFYIWDSYIYQMEQYKNFLIYNDATKGYTIISHDFITDKKKKILKGYGKDEKASFMEKLSCGKSMFQQPSTYVRLGNWLWIQDEKGSKIININQK